MYVLEGGSWCATTPNALRADQVVSSTLGVSPLGFSSNPHFRLYCGGKTLTALLPFSLRQASHFWKERKALSYLIANSPMPSFSRNVTKVRAPCGSTVACRHCSFGKLLNSPTSHTTRLHWGRPPPLPLATHYRMAASKPTVHEPPSNTRMCFVGHHQSPPTGKHGRAPY